MKEGDWVVRRGPHKLHGKVFGDHECIEGEPGMVAGLRPEGVVRVRWKKGNTSCIDQSCLKRDDDEALTEKTPKVFKMN